MIRLKQLLEQLAPEIGDVPLSDRWSDTPSKYQKYLTRIEIPDEPNTDLENKLLDYLQDYFADESSVTSDANISNLLRRMVQYRSKYPKMLNPTSSALMSNKVYRGTRLSLTLLKSLGFDEDLMLQQNALRENPTNFRLNGPVTINPRGKRGFFSFSGDLDIAETFMRMQSVSQHQGELYIPVILVVATTNPNLLFTPEFVHGLGGWSAENETVYVGQTIVADEILVYPYKQSRLPKKD